tara:strand:- start:3010 stop:3705 length:696 start_codon:yes stop_codon:yes gene_type:complete
MVNASRENIVEAIKSSSQQKNYRMVLGNKELFVKDDLPENINLDKVFDFIQKKIPNSMMYGFDAIYVGDFDELTVSGRNAAYKDGAIFLTNAQDDNMDIVDDIVHEIAHSLESLYGYEIYGDGEIEREFLAKRNTLEKILNQEGYDTSYYNFDNPLFDDDIDKFFYKDVGYALLNNLVNGLFASAYGATSLNEYFANGFEEYYLGDRNYLRTISYYLYQAINNLHTMGDNI